MGDFQKHRAGKLSVFRTDPAVKGAAVFYFAVANRGMDRFLRLFPTLHGWFAPPEKGFERAMIRAPFHHENVVSFDLFPSSNPSQAQGAKALGLANDGPV